MDFYVAHDGRAYSQRQMDQGSFPAPSPPIRDFGFSQSNPYVDYLVSASYGDMTVELPSLPAVPDPTVPPIAFPPFGYESMELEFPSYGYNASMGYPPLDVGQLAVFLPDPTALGDTSNFVTSPEASPSLSPGSSPSTTDAMSPPSTSTTFYHSRPSTSPRVSMDERMYGSERLDGMSEREIELRVDAFVTRHTTPGRPNCCALCNNQAFGRICDLRRHIESKHMRNEGQVRLERFKCLAEGCEESFSRRDSQIRHMKKFHRMTNATRMTTRTQGTSGRR